MIGHVNFGRLTVGLFPYWIGVSCRYLNCMGRIFDLGFIKIVWWPRRASLDIGESNR